MARTALLDPSLNELARPEVRSIPSPNHPSAADDIGSIAAKVKPGLADNLYPFQLVSS